MSDTTRNFEQLRYYVTFEEFAKKKRRGHALPVTQNLKVNALSITLILSYFYN